MRGSLVLRTRDALAVGAGYLLGSIPVGLWLGRLHRGVDVREHGSGATGATNVLRTVGPGAAAATFALDTAKGAVAVGLARALTKDRATAAAVGVAAVAGHSWPVWAEYRGGKGVTTGLGALAVLSPRAGLWAFAGGLTGSLISRRASVGSLVALATATAACATPKQRRRSWAPLAFTCVASAVILARHQENIRRLLAGTEPKLGATKRTVR